MFLVHSNHWGTIVIVSVCLQHLVEQILRVQNNLPKEIGKNLTLISAHNFCWEAPIYLIERETSNFSRETSYSINGIYKTKIQNNQ
jgi:hypothetical protein